MLVIIAEPEKIGDIEEKQDNLQQRQILLLVHE